MPTSNLDDLIGVIRREFPLAGIRLTSNERGAGAAPVRVIGWPIGSPATLQMIEARVVALGGAVERHPDGDRHWTVRPGPSAGSLLTS